MIPPSFGITGFIDTGYAQSKRQSPTYSNVFAVEDTDCQYQAKLRRRLMARPSGEMDVHAPSRSSNGLALHGTSSSVSAGYIIEFMLEDLEAVPADYVPAGHVLISADRYRICCSTSDPQQDDGVHLLDLIQYVVGLTFRLHHEVLSLQASTATVRSCGARDVVLRESYKPKTHGKLYYACPLSKPQKNYFGCEFFLWKEERVRLLISALGASSTLSYSPGPSTTPNFSPGASTPQIYSSKPSTPPSYSSGSSRNAEFSNCKHLLGKITILKVTVDMYMHPE
ncbi:hypothetical protein Tco_0318627 [Tanacetum coccineum]